MSVRRLRLFPDANILHAAALRDFLLRLAEAGVVDVRWSGAVLEETRRSLEGRGLPAHQVDRLINALRTAFPEAEVHGFEELIPEMDCSDPDDRHVLAAAITGEADYLVTDNTEHFPADTGERYDLAIITGDELAASLVRADPQMATLVTRSSPSTDDSTNPASVESRASLAASTATSESTWACRWPVGGQSFKLSLPASRKGRSPPAAACCSNAPTFSGLTPTRHR